MQTKGSDLSAKMNEGRHEGRQTRSEPDLIRAAQQGDRSAYDSLVERYQKQVYRWAFHFVRTHDLADEVAQEVFVRTFEALARLDPERALGAWLCRSTTNVALNMLRKKQFRARWVEENRARMQDAEDSVAQPDAELRSRRVIGRIGRAIDALSPTYRAVMLLRVKESMTYGEIAEALEISIGTVMSRLARARKRLRADLRDVMDDFLE